MKIKINFHANLADKIGYAKGKDILNVVVAQNKLANITINWYFD